MSSREVPAPHHVYDEATDLDSFSVSRTMRGLTAQIVYVEGTTHIPQEGEIVEFHVLGTSVQGVVEHSSLMPVGDETFVLIMAKRLRN